MINNPYQTYQKTQVETASQGKLILMLFDGAIKFTRNALQGLEEKNYEKTNTFLVKTQAIISELMLSLDRDAGGEIARNLYSLYDYMYWRLANANLKKDPEMIKEVLDMLADFRQTWEEVIKISRQKGADVDIKEGVSNS